MLITNWQRLSPFLGLKPAFDKMYFAYLSLLSDFQNTTFYVF